MRNDKIRPEALGYVEDLRAHLDPRRRYRKSPQFKAFALLEFFDDRQWLLACGVIVEDIRDLFAFEAAAQLVLDKLNRGGALRPIGRGDREEVGVAGPVRRCGDPEPGRGRRDL